MTERNVIVLAFISGCNQIKSIHYFSARKSKKIFYHHSAFFQTKLLLSDKSQKMIFADTHNGVYNRNMKQHCK
jgi:hypothetical protein